MQQTVTLPDFSKTRVLIAGDVMLDRYWHGPCSRISPEAPVPVVKVEEIEERPGGAANVAMNLASLGGQAVVLGVTGTDEAAKTLHDQLSNCGIDNISVPLVAHPTVTKLRILSRHQQLIRLDFEDGFPGLDAETLLGLFDEQLAHCALVILSDYGKGVLQQIEAFIERAVEYQLPVLVDPKGNDFSRYSGATLITPNLTELQAVVGLCRDQNELVDKGMQLLESINVSALLVTRSEQGMTLLQRDAQALHLPTQAREVFDVTGAGDTVIAVVGACLAAGLSLSEATALANTAAGLVVAKLGTASVTTQELIQAAQVESVPHGILDEKTLLQIVSAVKQRGETVVMTNGCFDILHPGHIRYLEQARQMGDRLLVAVNDDDSVRRLKGNNRPVNDLIARMQVLAGLAAVDWVVPFSEDTPERLICQVLPDYLVKGGDHAPATIAGGSCVRAAGGQVVALAYVEGYSTTSAIDKVLGR